MAIQRICQNPTCQKTFSRKPSKDGPYCSYACFTQMRPNEEVICQNPSCQKAFMARPSAQRQFCSSACSSEVRTLSPEVRFWLHVHKTETCWLWTGGATKSGYGHFGIQGRPQPRIQMDAHRYSFILHYGPIPDGLHILHNCPNGDNKLCVNPAHLRPGTNQDNMTDAAEKGQMPRGEENPGAKLLTEQVYAIRALEGKQSCHATARQFDVSPMTVWYIWERLTWKHLPEN